MVEKLRSLKHFDALVVGPEYPSLEFIDVVLVLLALLQPLYH